MELSKKYSPAPQDKLRKQEASALGVTLLEMALGMMILAILSVGVSCLVKAGVETQLSEQTHQNMQTIGMNIVDDLRYDIRVADQVTVTNGGNTLQVVLDAASGQTAFYELNGTAFSRREAGKMTKIYNDPNMYTSLMEISCPDANGCFKAEQLSAEQKLPKQILIPEIVVEKKLTSGNAGTVIDRHFASPNFKLRNFAFNVATATEFQ